jgi:glycosidase
LKVDDKTYLALGNYYNFTTKQFSLRLPERLSNGSHTMILSAGQNSDTVAITVQAGFVQITNIGNFTTRNPQRILYGVVEDTSIHRVKIIRNGKDTVETTASSGKFNETVQLVEGVNSYKAVVRATADEAQVSDSVTYTYFVSHSPNAEIHFIDSAANVTLSARGSSDPDTGQAQLLTFHWSGDSKNPQQVPGIDGADGDQITVSKPSIPGEYLFTLIATDPDGNKDTTRSFFTVLEDGTFQNFTLATVPRWVKQGRVYEMFFKSMTPQGSINAALPYLPYLKSLGVNILWLMPIMDNYGEINNRTGPGYNIVDFLNVAPEYGSNQDFKNFVRWAHELGLKVILDITPNHTSFRHPFVLHARQFRENSPYWSFYQHTIIPHNTNNLGQSTTADGFVYYSGFSDQLLNYNWSDVDARSYMIEVYKWWIREFDIDGYRFDVYWGPHRRADHGAGNELEMGLPVRKALKKLKPDIFLLAEDDGTGVGTEVIFGDRNGGVDAAYDWQLYGGAIKSFYSRSIDDLNTYITNFGGNAMGFVPGPNAAFMRFLENHDEDRIAYAYGLHEKTMPVSTAVFTAPGIPMIYSGQEVGFGPGLGDLDLRRRGVLDWNAGGKALLLPHYQRLAHIRAQSPAFSTQQFVRLTSGNSQVYSYIRPFANADGLTAVNFSSAPQDISLTLTSSSLATIIQNGKTYYANDLYNDTTYAVSFSGGSAALTFRLRPYGSAVFVLSDSVKRLSLPTLVSVEKPADNLPTDSEFRLDQNYPNPFNPLTNFEFRITNFEFVSLEIFDVLGRKVAVLANERKSPGIHRVTWDASGLPSGVYLCRIQAGAFSDVKKLVLVR